MGPLQPFPGGVCFSGICVRANAYFRLSQDPAIQGFWVETTVLEPRPDWGEGARQPVILRLFVGGDYSDEVRDQAWRKLRMEVARIQVPEKPPFHWPALHLSTFQARSVHEEMGPAYFFPLAERPGDWPI